MKKIFVYTAIAVLMSVKLSAQDCTSKVNINSANTLSAVFINSEYRGGVPLSLNLGKGIYEIKISESLRKWNPQIILDTIRISDCGEIITKDYEFKREILLNTEPQNATVTENRMVIGYTPMIFLSRLPEVTLKKKNYETVRIGGNDYSGIHPVELKYNGIKSNGDFFESGLFKILVGTAAALGATAAYFKIRADNKYNDYLNSKNASLLEDVDRLDLYSGIAFGLLQVNFGYLIYEFLSD